MTLDDIDDLISALSPEELKELSSVDPDVSMNFLGPRCIASLKSRMNFTELHLMFLFFYS